MFKELVKCEAKFFGLLTLFLFIINIIALLLKNIFEIAPFISILISALVIIVCVIYFIYQFVKVVFFNQEYECKNIYHRVSGWVSSVVG